MTMCHRIRVALFAAVAGVACLELAESFSASGGFSFITPAEAIVGRPLTPVSVAGVGRRTVRRCAAGVYYC